MKLKSKSKLVALFIAMASFAFVPIFTSAHNETCVPEIKSMSVNPSTITKQDQKVTFSVTLEAVGCIPNSKGWRVYIDWIDDNGQQYRDGNNYPIYTLAPAQDTIYSWEWKNVSANSSRVTVTVKSAPTAPFVGQTGKTISFRPSLYWKTEFVGVSSSQTKKVTYSQGGGGGGTGDPPPKDPPSPTTAICTTVGPDGKKVEKTIDLSKGEKCPGGTLSCANGATLTDGLCVGKEVKTLYNPIKSNTLVGLSLWIMKMFLAGVAALAIVFIVMGSFRLVVSRGNPEAVTRGKDILIWSIAGLAVALLAFSLVGMVQNLLGAF